jgi:hypothetical protein
MVPSQRAHSRTSTANTRRISSAEGQLADRLKSVFHRFRIDPAASWGLGPSDSVLLAVQHGGIAARIFTRP